MQASVLLLCLEIVLAEPGDLVIMLALSGAAPIQDRLRELGAK